MNTCTYANREAVLQFYNANNRTYFLYTANRNTLAHWIQFQTGNHQIWHAECESTQFELRGDRYAGLLSDVNKTPL
jgi:hypothetical protein